MLSQRQRNYNGCGSIHGFELKRGRYRGGFRVEQSRHAPARKDDQAISATTAPAAAAARKQNRSNGAELSALHRHSRQARPCNPRRLNRLRLLAAEFVFSAGLAPSQSWLATYKYILGVLLVVGGAVAAFFLLR